MVQGGRPATADRVGAEQLTRQHAHAFEDGAPRQAVESLVVLGHGLFQEEDPDFPAVGPSEERRLGTCRGVQSFMRGGQFDSVCVSPRTMHTLCPRGVHRA